MTDPDTKKKALVVLHRPDGQGSTVSELTRHLNDGWRIVSTSAMGGVGMYDGPAQFAALVVLEREEKKTVGGFTAA
ncbi:MAG TPA: hypothetical protein EYQ24_09720 [Bacteroidetes bacterium]|nr:hypothetical protein [Bacteroidota bacterium]HIL57221.1 hypothetical protein [Rhodothermales bacterium]